MKKFVLSSIFLVFLTANLLLAQSYSIGSWREHLPYIHAKKIVEGKNRIFCSTEDGFYSLQLDDNSIKRFSKLNGLSDFGVSTISYSNDYNLVVIAYNNTNIDLLYNDNSVVNISDIQRKNIPGNKVINTVYISGRFAYLGCGFGIVVLDLQRKEIKDTYYIGFNGASINVFQVAEDATYFYAATEDGVYQANKANPSLNNFNNWTKIIDDYLNSGDFNQAVVFNNNLFVNYSRASSDTILAWNGAWGVPLPNELKVTNKNYLVSSTNNHLNVVNSFSFSEFDNSLSRTRYIDGTLISSPEFRGGISDNTGKIWIADRNKGMLKIVNGNYEAVVPDGPNSSAVSDIKFSEGLMWAIHGPKNRGYNNAYQLLGFSYLDNGNWTTYDGVSAQTPLFNQYVFYDNVTTVIDPSDKNHIFVGASGPGLLEFSNGNPVKFYRDTNSTLLQQTNNPGQVKVHGLALDDDRNLWVGNAGTTRVLQVLKNNGSWKAFSFLGLINNSTKCGQLLIDDNGYKWLPIFENIGGDEGLLVFNDNGTIDDLNDDESQIVEFGSNRVRCIEKDLDGTIWAGTDQGIYLFYPPNLTPQQILIKQDNSFQYLLATDAITTIAVDGANRKWVGTENSGLYLFSSDGQTQIQHFTASGSPLFSDNITALAINDLTGEVFIGTDKGIISYQSDATPGKKSCGDLVAYPNPVRREYNGPIAVKGVVANGTFKVTDISGGLVFEGKCLGGQAVWDGRNIKGDMVTTGVYIIYAADATGENNCETKIMMYR